MDDALPFDPSSTSKRLGLRARRSKEKTPRPPDAHRIPRRRHPDPCVLSFAQERFWFFDRLNPSSAVYNLSVAIRLDGRLNIAALEETLTEIVRRHETLRTTFTVVEGQPLQRITSADRLRFPVIDLSGLRAEQRAAEVKRHARDEATKPFDLEHGPLARAALLRLGVEEYVMLFAMHHIISDGWSMGVLGQEIGALYAAFSRGYPSPLAELEIQYADFAVWQRERLSGEILEEQLAYWEQQLAGVEMLDLPLSYRRPAVQTYRGASHEIKLGAQLSEAVRALSRREGATLFMTLLAAWQCLLYRYSGQTDICVGSPVAARTHPQTEPLIGCFVNTLVLRTRLSEQDSFRELLARVRETALAALSHQEVPFERVVKRLQPERSLSHSPLFQVMFAWQSVPVSQLDLPGLKITLLDNENDPQMFELILSMRETNEEVAGVLRYNTDLFAAESIASLLEYFRRLLDEVTMNPDCNILDIPLESKELERYADSTANPRRTDSAEDQFAL